MRPIDADRLPLKDWKSGAAMFQDDYTAGAGTGWALIVAASENWMIWDMIRAIEEAPAVIQSSNEPLPVLVNDEPDREYIDYICPRCKDIISQRRRGQRMETVYQCKYHDNCGQRVDWNNSQPYRRPPEGEEDNNG